jgi:CP family cyanate transporter-like MFS transporter
MSGLVAGLLTSVPVVCFAVVGSLAPATARRFGAHRTLAAALVLMVAGVLLRAFAGNAATFIACSVLALVGGAIGNVLLPMLVKMHFPDRVGLLTAVYTTCLAVGATVAAAATVPIASAAAGSEWFGETSQTWRFGLGVWAVPAVVAVLAWVVVLRRRAVLVAAAVGGVGAPRTAARGRLGWGLAVYFGTQSLQAYVAVGWFALFFREAGTSARTAGFLLGLVSGLTIPISMVVPAVAARLRSQRSIVMVLVLCYVVAYTGMLVAPLRGAWVWALLVGIGAGAFPLALTLIGLKSTTPDETVSLSAFTQGVGYSIAAVGPLLVGWLHADGGWTGPFVVLFAALALQVVSGWYVAGPVRRTAD